MYDFQAFPNGIIVGCHRRKDNQIASLFSSTTQDKSVTSFIRLVYNAYSYSHRKCVAGTVSQNNGDVKADRKGAGLPTCLDQQLAFIFPGDRTVKARLIGNQSKH